MQVVQWVTGPTTRGPGRRSIEKIYHHNASLTAFQTETLSRQRLSMLLLADACRTKVANVTPSNNNLHINTLPLSLLNSSADFRSLFKAARGGLGERGHLETTCTLSSCRKIRDGIHLLTECRGTVNERRKIGELLSFQSEGPCIHGTAGRGRAVGCSFSWQGSGTARKKCSGDGGSAFKVAILCWNERHRRVPLKSELIVF
mmetsp:Transcript_47989/g.94735  ORF Transcript_47989/g.94735 Transcript_47989/m.94735 type:complete len:202 (+) Transcript_47989:893-1498(+)